MWDLTGQGAAEADAGKPVLNGGILSMPVRTFVMLREIAAGGKLWDGVVPKSDEARVQGLVEAGLVMHRSNSYVVTDAGEQVAGAVARTCRDDMWPSNGIVQVDVNALGW